MDTQEIKIQVVFKIETPYGIYQDALWFSEEEYALKTREDIEAQKQSRVDSWIAIVSAPSKVLSDEEKKVQIQNEINRTASIVAIWNSRIATLESEKAVIEAKMEENL